ncbi:phage terminase large subunit family protein [Pseudacidovorax sp. NFM-22]|uniref:phage terminase large subunit family protein n=1 Tax=Pseudacidovorax sp. NFM-22 TaxID=2744469 RepID=UPI001F229545|nr:terminase gpA endonuclease subunit [Pseudacidovorax sp. NFM-22]
MSLADGHELIVRKAIEGARPDPELRVDDWAEEHIILPKSGAQPGEFRFTRTPYARRVHQVLSPSHPSKRVVARVASQMFKTQTALNWIGSIMHRRPRNILALEPTDTLVKRFSARVSIMIRLAKDGVLTSRVAAAKSRDSRNTVQAKDFLGDATLYMNTAGSAANLAEVSAPYIYVDEIDRLERNVDDEGDPVELAEARATQFGNDCKFFYTSSPSVVGFSKIDELHALGTQEEYHVPCPHCGELHPLLLERFRYRRDPDTGYMDRAWFVCPACGADIEEHHKATLLPDEAAGGTARWVATSRGDGETISFTMSAFYMPVGAITWLSLARQYARAKERLARGDHEAMQVFYNTRLGLSYQNTERVSTAKDLMDRAEGYASRVLPDQALVATMAVDTQANRLEVQIEAWGPGMEHWVLDYVVLSGSPSVPPTTEGSVWQRLDELRRTPLMHAGGGKPIYISAYGIDSAGHNTQDVYNYGSGRQAMGCTVLHGATRPNRPVISSAPSRVDIDWNGKKTPGGVELWQVGTDVAKDYLHNRMQLQGGPGAMHFHKDLPPAWFEGLVIEQPRTRYARGRTIREWINPPGGRNEPLDLSVYNLAVAYKLGLHRWSDLDWSRLRRKLVPPGATPDLFVAQPPPVTPLPAPPVDAAQAVDLLDVPRETAAGSPPVHTSGQAAAEPVPLPPVAPPPAHASPPPPVQAAPLPPPALAGPAYGGRRYRSRGIQ